MTCVLRMECTQTTDTLYNQLRSTGKKEHFINAHQMYPFTSVKAFHLATSISLKERLVHFIHIGQSERSFVAMPREVVTFSILFFRDFQAMK